MKIKATMRYHLILVRMPIIKKSKDKFWKGLGERGSLLYYWWECELVKSLWRTILRFLKKKKKTKKELPYDPEIPLLAI